VVDLKRKLEDLFRLAAFAEFFSSFEDEFGTFLAGYQCGVTNAAVRISMTDPSLMADVMIGSNEMPDITPAQGDIFSSMFRTAYDLSKKNHAALEKEDPKIIKVTRLGRLSILRGDKHSPGKVS